MWKTSRGHAAKAMGMPACMLPRPMQPPWMQPRLSQPVGKLPRSWQPNVDTQSRLGMRACTLPRPWQPLWARSQGQGNPGGHAGKGKSKPN